MKTTRLAVCAALLAPFLWQQWAAPRLADRLGTAAGAELGELVARLEDAVAPAAPGPIAMPDAVESSEPAWIADLEEPDPPAHRPTQPHGPVRGIRVRAATVLRLARAGVRPTGTPVAADATHPAGLLMTGVGGLGVGLQDGDVLTEAGGAPATSVAVVVSAVVAARSAHAPAVGGRFYRGRDRYALVVEMPYPP